MQRDVEEVEEQQSSGGAMSLERAISAVRKRLKLVVAMPLVAAALAALLVWTMPNRYDASAIIQIDPRQKSITNIEGVIPDLKGDQPSIESEVEVIRSRPIILQVIETLNLRNDPDFNKPPFGVWLSRKLGIGKAAEQTPIAQRPLDKPRDQIADIINLDEPGSSRPERDEVAVAFLDKLKVMRVRNTLLIDIRFSASDAVKSARIANTIAEVYLKDQLGSKTRAASTATQLLEQKIEDMRKKVAEAEGKVERWKAANGVFDAEGQVLSEKELARLMEQTVVARNTAAEAKAKYEQAQKLARAGDGGTAIVEVLQSHTVRLLKEQLANVQRKSAELKTKYGPKHPEILKVDAEEAQAQSQLQAEIDRLVVNLKNEHEVAEGRLRQLDANLEALKNNQVATKGAGVELKELEREAATSKQLFEALLTRYKQTAETQNFQLPDARIVEKADAPLYPASPKRKQLVLMAAAGGLILALALSILLEMFAPGISRGEDVERALSLSHLSSVPVMGAAAEIPSKSVRLIVAEPSSVFADAIRNARRELDLRRSAQGPRVVLVTSSIAGEGAHLIASNLAHHYAMTGTRVLLVDGDFRLQPLTRQLAAQRQTGLLDQIVNGQPPENAILRDGLTGLHFLPAASAGPAQSSIPETLSSSRFEHAMAALKSRFDVVLVSAPPLMPVIDGRILADYADQVVFVMGWQTTPKQLAKKALKSLGFNERKVAGVVLNGVADDMQDAASGLSLPGGWLGRHDAHQSGPRYAA